MNYMLLNLPQQGPQGEIRRQVLKSSTYVIESDKFHFTFPSRILIESLSVSGLKAWYLLFFVGNRIDLMKGILYV
jgi:hypothetical protein